MVYYKPLKLGFWYLLDYGVKNKKITQCMVTKSFTSLTYKPYTVLKNTADKLTLKE